MAIKFTEKNHKYESVDGSNIEWVSATSFVGKFKLPFDQEAIAKKSSKNKKSKWFGIPWKEIIEIWNKETQRALTLGTWFHEEREKDIIACDTIERSGVPVPIVRPIVDGDIKLAPDQRLVEGIYPEHMVYLKSAKICGQADRVEVVGDTIDLFDYKTNKEIKVKGYTNWEGVTKKMLGPCSHLDDCNLNHYALQLSVYMYIMLKHNHHLKPGKMALHHIIFEKEGEDEHGYPITAYGPNGDPIVKQVVEYEVPYLKDEVRSMIKWLKLGKV